MIIYIYIIYYTYYIHIIRLWITKILDNQKNLETPLFVYFTIHLPLILLSVFASINFTGLHYSLLLVSLLMDG